MLHYLLKINEYKNYLSCFLILFLFWISINTGSKYLVMDYSIHNNLGILINLLRSLIPYFLILFFLIFFKKFKVIEILKSNWFFKLFFLYGLLQLIGLIYIGENLHEHYWAICLFALLLFFNFILQIKDKNICNFIFSINKIFLASIFLIFFFLALKENLFSQNLLYHSKAFVSDYNHERMPRATGLARMSLIIFICSNALFFSNIFSKKIKLTLLIINIFTISVIFIFQSRGALLSFCIILVLINLIYNFSNLKNRLLYVLVSTLIPLLIFLSYPIIKKNLIVEFGLEESSNKNFKKHNFKNMDMDVEIRGDFFKIDQSNSVKENLSSLSNNRFYAWEFLLQVFLKKEISEDIKKAVESQDYDIAGFDFKDKFSYFVGYGPQADRYFMYNQMVNRKKSKEVLGPFGFHASNGYLYSLICSGIMGLITFLAINLIVFTKILRIFLTKKSLHINSNPFLSSSILCILYLQFRILFENSFSVYGIDMLIFLSSYLIIENEFKNLNN